MLAALWILAALAILPAMFSDDDPESSGEDPDPVDEPSLGEDLLTGTYQDDEVSAWPERFNLAESFGNDTLRGLEGNDTLDATYGNDLLYGGEGNDSLDGFVGNDTLYGGAGHDRLYGDVGRDLLLGEDGNDQLFSLDGGDSIFFGGQGSDGLHSGGAGSVLDGGAGGDYLRFAAETTVTGGEGYDILTGDITLGTPNNLAPTITDFDPSQDYLSFFVDGLTGDDTDPALRLVDWADGTGVDLMLGDQVIARLVGLESKDHAAILDRVGIGIEPAEVVIHDGAQSSILSGGATEDLIYGGDGDDQIDVTFQDGKEYQDERGDLAEGGNGNDTLIGLGGDAYYDSYDDDDSEGQLVMLVHEDSLIGGAGDDVLRAGNGSMMTGGDGADRFEVTLNEAYVPEGESYPPARITDFDPATDSLKVQAIGPQQMGAISVVRWADGLGSDVLIGRTVVARVTGGQDLTVADLIAPEAAAA